MREEIITIKAPAGTRKRLASIRKSSGLTNEDIFKLGLRYVMLKAAHDNKTRERNGSIIE